MGNLGSTTIIKDQSLLNHEAIKRQIVIVDELRDLIPPLQEEEYSQLEKNILAEGCREALMIWDTAKTTIDPTSTEVGNCYVLVDGHNRYGICQKHQIDFKIHLVSFASLKDVKDYMIDNQLGRRNLIPEQASYLRGLRYNAEKLEKGKYSREDHKGQNVPYDASETEEHKGQNVPYGSSAKKEATATRLAKQYNVSEKTIKRDAEFAEGLNVLAPELKQAILSGKVKAKKADIQQLGQLSSSNETPIVSLEQVASIVGTTKSTGEDTLTSEKQLVKKKIQEVVQKLANTDSFNLCDELISLSNELKLLIQSPDIQ